MSEGAVLLQALYTVQYTADATEYSLLTTGRGSLKFEQRDGLAKLIKINVGLHVRDSNVMCTCKCHRSRTTSATQCGPRSFAVTRPVELSSGTIYPNLPEYLRDPELSIDYFKHQLKTFLFAQY